MRKIELPFTVEQFYGVFHEYNEALWPAPVFLAGSALGAGHRYPVMPIFGLSCPTTIFTIGLLAFAVAPYPRTVLIVPILWCFVGAQAAFLLGVPQDLGLVAAGLTGIVLLVRAKGTVVAEDIST